MSQAASQAISGTGAINFASKSDPRVLAGIAAAVLATLVIIVVLITRK